MGWHPQIQEWDRWQFLSLSLSLPILFGLCIDELEQMVNEYVKQECIEGVAIGNVLILLLLYANDVMLFAYTLEDAQKHF